MPCPLTALYTHQMAKLDAWLESIATDELYTASVYTAVLLETHFHREDPAWHPPTVREIIAKAEEGLKAAGKTVLRADGGLGAISRLVFHGKIRFVEATPELDDLKRMPLMSLKTWLLIRRFAKRCPDLRVMTVATPSPTKVGSAPARA